MSNIISIDERGLERFLYSEARIDGKVGILVEDRRGFYLALKDSRYEVVTGKKIEFMQRNLGRAAEEKKIHCFRVVLE